MIWFGFCWVLSYIDHCRLFNDKSFLYIYIKYIWFGLVEFYDISTMVGYSMLNPVYTYISYIIFDLVWFCWVLSYINHCRLFNDKSFLYIYIKYIWFGLVEFYDISTMVGYSMLNPVYAYISYIQFDLVWFCWVLSIIVGHLKSNPLYTYILNIYDIV